MKNLFILSTVFFIFTSCSISPEYDKTSKSIEVTNKVESISEYDKVINKNEYNLLISETSPNVQYKFELYSLGDRCGCYAYPCRLNVIDNLQQKMLYELNSEHMGPCHLLPIGGTPVKWYDENNILVKDIFGDSGTYGYTYQLYNVIDDSTVELLHYNKDSFYTYPLHFVSFANNKYLLDTNNDKLVIYKVPKDLGGDIYSGNGDSIIYDKLLFIDEIDIVGKFEILDSYNGIYFQIGENKYQFMEGKIINFIQSKK